MPSFTKTVQTAPDSTTLTGEELLPVIQGNKTTKIKASILQNSVLKGDAGVQGEKGDTGPPGAPGSGMPTGGFAGQVLAKVTDADYQLTWVEMTGGGSSSSGGGSTYPIIQVGHGFTVGKVLTLSGSTFVTAEANIAANADVVGIVSAVSDADNFTLATGGYVTGLSGLSAGSTYYLSPTVAGGLTATEPSTIGQISKPILLADTATSGYFINYRGIVIGGSSGTITYAGPPAFNIQLQQIYGGF